MNDDNILLNRIDPFGEENGFCTIILSVIYFFNEDIIYSQKIQKLFAIKNQERKYISSLTTNPIIDILNYAVANNLLIEVNEDNSYTYYQ